MATNFKKLQNGSDIRGVALEGIPGEAVNLTEEAAWYLTMGFVHWLAEKTGKKIPVIEWLAMMGRTKHLQKPLLTLFFLL